MTEIDRPGDEKEKEKDTAIVFAGPENGENMSIDEEHPDINMDAVNHVQNAMNVPMYKKDEFSVKVMIVSEIEAVSVVAKAYVGFIQ